MDKWTKNRVDARQQGDFDRQNAEVDPVLDQALRNFKLSVDAWSEAAYSNRRIAFAAPRRNWRPVVTWALGCALIASSVSGVVYQRHEREIQAKLAEQARIALQQKAAEKQAVNEEDLLASVDSDVSRQVPTALEPLAQMAEDDSK
jgi:hypothetical protein